MTVTRFAKRAARMVHAVQWDDTDETFEVLTAFTGNQVHRPETPVEGVSLIVATSLGDLPANPGEWIVNEDGAAGLLILSDEMLRQAYYELPDDAPSTFDEYVAVEWDVDGWRVVLRSKEGVEVWHTGSVELDKALVLAAVYAPGRPVMQEDDPEIPGAPSHVPPDTHDFVAGEMVPALCSVCGHSEKWYEHSTGA